jgi:heat shock protein HslJ
MKHTSLILLVFLAIALLVAGCASQQPAVQPATPAATQNPAPVQTATPAATSVPAQLAGDWTLTTMGIQGGTAVTYPTTAISLTFNQDGSLAGYDGCNNYFGTFTLTGTTTPKGQGMALSGIGSSKKYCAELANQEQQYLNILSKTNAYVVDGTQLTLTGEMGDVLIYQRPQTLVTPARAPGY